MVTANQLVSANSPNGVNAKSLTSDDINRTLEYLRQNDPKRRMYSAPRDYQTFLPQTLGIQKPDTSQWDQTLQSIENVGKSATELSLIIAQNRAAKQQLERAQKQKKKQDKYLAQQQQQFITGGGSNTPGPIKGFNPHAPLKSYNWRGYSLRLNSSVAGRFIGFLNALSAEGYKIKSIGTYANRPIAGTNTQSLHALGLAMDINPSQNPVTYNGHNITNLPPNVGALAAKYGLKWGGSWIHNKRDPMHFSVPYGGRM